MKTGLVGPAYTARYPVAACNTLINMYIEVAKSGGKEPAALMQWCGETLYGSAPLAGEVRGMISCSNGNGYAAVGQKIYSLISGSFSPITESGVDFEMDRDTGLVDAAEDGTNVVIVDGLAGYILNISSNTATKITDTDFPNGSTTIEWMDGYFIAGRPLTQQYCISTDGSTWEPLEFASAEAKPDRLLSILAINREARLFGTTTTESIVNSGSSTFPFVRPGGGVIQIGIAAPRSACRVNNTALFLGRAENGDGTVYQITGLSSASRVSTHALEYEIGQWPDISDAFAYSMHLEGHSWYVLTSPSGNQTWVYDFSTETWFQAAELIDGELRRRRGNCYMFHEGKHLTGDYTNGKIYEMSLDACTLDGRTFLRQRAWRQANVEGNNISYQTLTVDAQTGVGLDGGVFGSEPVLLLDWSNDGGRTWPGHDEASLGEIGEYEPTVKFNRLGMSKDRVFRVSVTDPVKFAVVGAYLDAKAHA